MKKKRKKIGIILLTTILIFFTALFVMPIVFTICNSFMGSTEITANYGMIFDTTDSGAKKFISDTVNLKFIPDRVSCSNRFTTEWESSFEFDGKYFHADCRLFKPIDYIAKRGLTAKEIWENDKNKELLCEKLNIKLVRIKEYDWLENKQAEMDKIYKYIIEYSNRGL